MRPQVTSAGDANALTVVTMHENQSPFDPTYAKDR